MKNFFTLFAHRNDVKIDGQIMKNHEISIIPKYVLILLDLDREVHPKPRRSCAKRRRERASHVRDRRRGRAEARDHAGETLIVLEQKYDVAPEISLSTIFHSEISFSAIFPSLAFV